ncbi:MAG: hypothetical protein ACE5RN_01585 [Nitrosopumilaceae archaeon]
MEQIHKISVIGVLAVIVGIITLGPAMADKDSISDNNKINICHFNNEDKEFSEITIPEEKSKEHAKNHANDIIPAPIDGCPEQNNLKIDTKSNNKINMDEFIEDLAKHDEVISEITNSKCSVGEVVTGFGPNGELLCSPDNVGEANPINIISRTDTTEIQSGQRLIKEYYCDSGEIIIGGIIEMPSMASPLSNSGNMISSTEQSYNIVTGTNNTPEPITVNVTYLCYVI